MSLLKNLLLAFLFALLPIILNSQITNGIIEIVRLDSFSPQNDFAKRRTSFHEGSDTIVIFENGKESIAIIDKSNFNRTFERERDTIKYLFTAANVFSVSEQWGSRLVKHYDFEKMESCNYLFQNGIYKKQVTFRMFEDYHLPAEEVTDYQEDKTQTLRIAGIEGFQVTWRIQTKTGEKVVKGYISEKVSFPLALTSPMGKKVQFIPLYLEEYPIEKPENKRIIQLLSLQETDIQTVKKQISTYPLEEN